VPCAGRLVAKASGPSAVKEGRRMRGGGVERRGEESEDAGAMRREELES
jgi:hypothetical protein